MTQGTVTVQDLLILGGIVELDLAGAEALGYLEHEASRFGAEVMVLGCMMPFR